MALMLTPLFLRNLKRTISFRYFGLTSVLLLLLTIPLWAWSQPYQRSETLDENIRFNTLSFDGGQMHYAYAGDQSKAGVIFVHGTPGSWGAFEVYLENTSLQNDFFMVSVDRLGWGASTLSKDQHLDGNFTPQSQSIIKVMQAYPDKKWTIVGHSLGASLAPQIALDAPQQVYGLVLLAGSLNPKLGKPRWYNYAASTWLLSKLVGKMMRNSNREIMALRKQLETMTEAIKEQKLNVKLSVMQGMKDRLVSPKNSAYVDEHWRSNFAEVKIIELPNEGHFLPWRQTPLVIETIRSVTP